MARIHSTASWVKRGKEGNTTYYVESRGRSKGKVTFTDTGYTSYAEAATKILGITFEITLKSTDETYAGSYTTTVYCPVWASASEGSFVEYEDEAFENMFTRAGIVPYGISDNTLTIRVVSKLLHFNGAPPKETYSIKFTYPVGNGKFSDKTVDVKFGSTATPIASDTTVDISSVIDCTSNVAEYTNYGFAGVPFVEIDRKSGSGPIGGLIGFSI